MLHVVYGNFDLSGRFPDLPIREVSLSQFATTKEMFAAIAADPTKVTVVTDLHRIKLFYENYVSTALAKVDKGIIVLGEIRFDYYREVKKLFSTFIQHLATRPDIIVLTFPLMEKENNTFHRIYPAGYEDFENYGQFFKSIVPVNLANSPQCGIPLSLQKNVKHSTLEEFFTDLVKTIPVPIEPPKT